MLENEQLTNADLIEGFRVHLLSTCGASSGTSYRYTTHARKFLQWKSEGEIDLASIGPADLIAYVSEYAFKHKPKTSKLAVTAIRSFLRFLQLKGLCSTHLIDAVPTVPTWKLSSLPDYLSPSQTERLLSVFDRTTATGRRGYAITQCMLLLGLRAGEVAQLSLDHIDWRTGVVGIPQTKSRRVDKLPLSAVAGEAVVAYLRDGRPPTSSRRIFVSHGRPYGKAISSSAISRIVRNAFGRSGMNVTSRGSHILRHTAATMLVQAGVSIKEISDVLRHRQLDTTMIYAKVDLPNLREVVMPWPEVKP